MKKNIQLQPIQECFKLQLKVTKYFNHRKVHVHSTLMYMDSICSLVWWLYPYMKKWTLRAF